MARGRGSAGLVVGDELAFEVDGDHLCIVLAGMLMGCARVTSPSVSPLRAPADRCESIAQAEYPLWSPECS
ncbi:hypothetical protein [Paenirhodobacter populi]|uniref:Uncharacterized protein n=1 Tax=Paenirhodobacter populi TaxID=2306993 RepID=A0A443JG15_9RHOB|nr:hypothetical protein [Sinirhodobacter populi]RWR19485.1 hypothetical protein D2T30_13230 [Sinirhodobacter populi]